MSADSSRFPGPVTIYDNGQIIATVEARPDGSWSYTPQPLTLGAHVFTAEADGEVSKPYSLEVMAMELAAPSLKEAAGSDTVDLQLVIGNSATVAIPTGQLYIGDTVFLSWRGTTASGAPITYDADEVIKSGEEVEKSFMVPRENLDPLASGKLSLSYKVVSGTSGGVKYSVASTYSVIRTVVQVVGSRSHSGPHYYSNLSLLSASSDGSGEIYWKYVDGDENPEPANFFLDTDPEKNLIVTLRKEGLEVERKILRPSNITGVFNLPNRHSGCITKDDGSLFAWGGSAEMSPPPDLANGRFTLGGGGAYAVIKQDGTVTAWGDPDLGGSIPADAQPRLTQVKKLAASGGAFLALRTDGQVIAWGHPEYGGIIPDEIASQLVQVTGLAGSTSDFSVVLSDGSVFSWGQSWPNGVRIDAAKGTSRICASNRAFAGIKSDGRVHAWGSSEHGGSIPDELISQLINVKILASTSAAFSALTADDRVISWGNTRFGGSAPAGLQDVRHVTGSTTAFCALKKDGSLSAWGEPEEGGRLPMLEDRVRSISASYGSFAAVLENTSVVCWGVTTAVPGFTPVAGTYAAGAGFVAITQRGDLTAIGSDAPDLTSLKGQVSYYYQVPLDRGFYAPGDGR